MINNRQINLWRGDNYPPTIYHVWLTNSKQLLVYNEEIQKWEVILDQANTIEAIKTILQNISNIKKYTINGYNISDNPELKDSDIKLSISGTYIKDDISTSLQNIDALLTTQFIE